VVQATALADPQPRVLAVNDFTDQLEQWRDLLNACGYEVHTSSNGAIALEMAERLRPDLIISDVMMPVMNGLALVDAIRRHPELDDTLVVLASGVRRGRDDALAGMARGADDYLELPYDPLRLVAKVARLLERRRTARALLESQQALQRSEARVRLLLDSTAEAIYALDLDGRCTMCNLAGVRMLGYDSTEELVGQRMHTLAHYQRADGTPIPVDECAIYRAARTGERSHVVGEVFWRKDGTSFPAEYWSYPVRDQAQLVGAVVTFFDITERRRADEALRLSEERFRALVEHNSEAVFVVDAGGVIGFASESVLRVTGTRASDWIGHSVFERVHPDDHARVDEALVACLTLSSASLSVAYRSRHADGSWRHREASVVNRLDEPAVGGLIVNFRDVTDRVRLETALRQAQKMEAIGSLASGIAHDFNNLLTAILGFTELTLSQLDGAHPVRPDLEEVEKAATSAAALTRQLLAFSRKQILQPEVLDLNAAVDRIEKLLRRTLGENISLLTHLATPLGRVMADAGQIEQVILNLAVNARDAMPEGGALTIETKNVVLDADYAIQHPDASAGPHVLIAISDTGIGMDATVQSHLFEPFFTTKERGKGTGLGLATVYGIVSQSGGSVSVYSEVGYGTTFNIYLPVAGSAVQPANPLPVEPARGTETILLVEDQPEVLAVTRSTLERHGYTVIAAASALEALQQARIHGSTVALLLTDVVMPGMSGRELATTLRRDRPALRVLYMSGYTDGIIVHHGVLDPDVSFIQKPFTLNALLARVRERLDADS
jgi:two-component system NtrC family sensor kinase